MRSLPVLLVMPLIVCAAETSTVAWAQSSSGERATLRVRPAFDPPPTKGKTVSGILHLTLTGRGDGPQRFRATVGSEGWAVAARLDTLALGTISRLPASVECDTRRVPDGEHTLTLALINTITEQELVVETETIQIDNHLASATVPGTPTNASDAAGALSVTRRPRRQIVLPSIATPTPLAATVAASSNPLKATATALLRRGDRLYLGLADGGIAFCNPDSRDPAGTVVRCTAGSEAAKGAGGNSVRSLAVGLGSVWWVTENGDRVYAFRNRDRSVLSFDCVAPAPAPLAAESAPQATDTSVRQGWVRRVAVTASGQILLTGSDWGLTRLLDPKTGVLSAPLSTPAGSLPEGIATAESQLFLVGANDSGAASFLVALTLGDDTPQARYHLSAFQTGSGGAWQAAGEVGTSVDPDHGERFSLTPDGIAFLEPEGIRLLLAGKAGAPGSSPTPLDLPFRHSPGMPASASRVGLGGSGVWWTTRGTVFHSDLKGEAQEAYLPWNFEGSAGDILALCADRDGTWVATANRGVRFIRPGSPSERDGYNGFVRARLGDGTMTPPDDRDRTIASVIEEWQGVPYLWGGQTKAGTDCSGFVGSLHRAVGVSIPRTTHDMGLTHKGGRIKDELQWGDTLVFPGHCALYIGDGCTAETVGGSAGGSVSKSSIWARQTVIVRRFLP